jgi:hypothetical protein
MCFDQCGHHQVLELVGEETAFARKTVEPIDNKDSFTFYLTIEIIS